MAVVGGVLMIANIVMTIIGRKGKTQNVSSPARSEGDDLEKAPRNAEEDRRVEPELTGAKNAAAVAEAIELGRPQRVTGIAFA
eukprot:gene11034-18636_t